jgi:hypothetical protein
MTTKFTLALAAMAAMAIAGQAAAQATAQPAAQTRDCFYVGTIRGFSAVDDETVNLRVGGRNDIVQIKLFAPSNDLRWTNGVALVSRGGSFICSKLDAELIVPGPTGPQRYPVSSVHRLTPQEVAALPNKQRP